MSQETQSQAENNQDFESGRASFSRVRITIDAAAEAFQVTVGFSALLRLLRHLR